MSKKVIVTGVSGQDASYMVDYLLANTDYLIYGMVRRSAKPDYSNLDESLDNPRFHLVTADLSDTTSIDNIVKEIKPDYFINLAAQSFVGSSWTLPEQTFDVNATGVIRCLEAIRKHVPQCRFYNAGSSEEFGDVQYSPQDEKHPTRARSVYGASKAAARQIVKVYRESYGLYAVQGLLYNHESERRGEEFVTRKITKGVARIAKSLALKKMYSFEPIKLGNLDSKGDWSHAKDFVDGIWKILNQEGNLQEYILASGETHSIREFVEKAFTIAGIKGYWKKSKPEDERFICEHWHDASNGTGWTEWLTLVEVDPSFYRPAEVSLLHGDSSRARNELNWKPQYSFDELVRCMVENDLKEVGLMTNLWTKL